LIEFNQLYPALSVSSLKLSEIAISLKTFTQWPDQSVCVKQNLLHDDLYDFIYFLEITIQSIFEDGTTEQTMFGTINVSELIWNSLIATHIT